MARMFGGFGGLLAIIGRPRPGPGGASRVTKGTWCHLASELGATWHRNSVPNGAEFRLPILHFSRELMKNSCAVKHEHWCQVVTMFGAKWHTRSGEAQNFSFFNRAERNKNNFSPRVSWNMVTKQQPEGPDPICTGGGVGVSFLMPRRGGGGGYTPNHCAWSLNATDENRP